MGLSNKGTDYVRRTVQNEGKIDTYGLPSQVKQNIDAEYARQKDASTKR